MFCCNQNSGVDEHHPLGDVEHVLDFTDPTCDAALIFCGVDMCFSNNIRDASEQTVYLERDPIDAKVGDIVHRFSDGVTPKDGAVGVIHGMSWNLNKPVIKDCVVIDNIEGERGDSGLLVTSVPSMRGNRWTTHGVAIVIAIQLCQRAATQIGC
jgi:hypothetical protein